jgi:type IX secretion system PorP/SprF family membrane protein
MMFNKNIILILLLFFGLKLSSQDIHFSQFGMSPLNLNPAFTGFFDGDFRAVANYRSQWTSVPVSYSTTSISFDAKRAIKNNMLNNLGAGLLFNNDVSGDSRYGITQLYIPLSFNKTTGKDSSIFFGFGVQPGISNIGFRTSKLTYDNQWDGDAYNSALPTGENYSILKRTYFDLNAGAMLQMRVTQSSVFTFGLSLSHLTSPKVSFFKNDEIKLDQKINSYLAYRISFSPKLNLQTEYLFQRQGKFMENVVGARMSYVINVAEKQAVSVGSYYRLKDAVIARIGYDVKQWQFGVSYDVNNSAFKAATNRRGAIEFAVIYIFRQASIFIPKKRSCPVFM